MYKRIKHIALITMMLCVSTISKAYDFKDGNCYYTITSLSEQTVELTNGGEPYDGDFVVPQTAEYSGKTFKVTSIGDNALQNCNLEKLTIPSTVISASIGGTIQNLIIEDSSIPLSKLRCTESIKDVYMGRNMSVEWNHLADLCFSSTNIEKIVFGDSVTYIAGGILGNCQELVSVELSNSIKEILTSAFEGCTKLKTISGQNVELIETGAFSNCTSLESFNFPNLKTLDNGDSQWGTYRWGVFQGCTNLKNIVLPKGLVSIGTLAFMDCTSLESVIIPASIVCIGDKQNLEHSSVFANCPLLQSITINNPMPIAIGETTFDPQTYINATLKTPIGTKNKYMNTENWKNFFTIEEDANIDDDIFSVVLNGCSGYSGYVEVGDKKITDNDTVITAKKNEIITLKFIPQYEYDVTVDVNGVDLTENVIDNKLSIEVTGNMTININWVYAEDPIFLSIKQADNGNVKLKVSMWDSYKVIFEPAEEWIIHSVSFNGTDVTNDLSPDNSYWIPEMTENSELIVIYISATTAINETYSESSLPKVVGYSGCITISNAKDGESIYVYTTAGVLVNTSISNNGTAMIRVQENEVYIVKVGNKTFKIGM